MNLTNVTNWQQINSVLKVDVVANATVEGGKCQIIVPYYSLGDDFDVQFKNYVLSQLGVENGQI